MNNELESKDIAADLCKLALLLNTYGLCTDVSPLNNAGQSFIQKDSSTWDYELQKITFTNADEVGGRLPSDSMEISITLSLNINGQQVETTEIYNPLSKLNVDIEIDGRRINPASFEVEDLYSCWHLDLHIEENGDGQPKYCHPMYHFAFGGNKMEARGDAFFGSGIFLPAPRLIHPPMDAVLAIDFILQNYFERSRIQKLLEDSSYVEIVRNSQNRLWKPFFSSLYSYWNAENLTVNKDFSYSKVLPLYH